MPLITLTEILYLVILTFAIGFIFSGIVRLPKSDLEIVQVKKIFDWETIKFASLVAAPGIILHELAHKFSAMAFGLEAVFHIWPTGLGIGIILRILNLGFIFVAPGYVSIVGANVFQSIITAFAGPLMNLILWLGAGYYLKKNMNLSRRTAIGVVLLKEINKWLFIFNMIPIPPLDGSKVLFGLISLF